MKLVKTVKLSKRIRYFCNVDENSIIVLTGLKCSAPTFFTSKYEEYNLKLCVFNEEKEKAEKNYKMSGINDIEMYLRELNNKMDRIVEKVDVLSDRLDKIESQIDSNNKLK